MSSTLTLPTEIAHVLYNCDEGENCTVSWPVADYDESGSPTETDSDAILTNTGLLELDLSQLNLEQLRNLMTAATSILFERIKEDQANR